MMRTFLAMALTSLAVACSGEQTPGLAVDNPEYRPPLVDGGTGVAYFSITSTVADRITGVSSPQAQAVEIHESTSAGGMAGMERRDVVELPAGKTVTFGPGGLHLMVIQPQQLAPVATFPIQITLGSGRVETVSFARATVE
jgi:copper(I)-binding protein